MFGIHRHSALDVYSFDSPTEYMPVRTDEVVVAGIVVVLVVVLIVIR